MTESRKDVEEGFYNAVAEMLGTVHDYKPFPYARKTRWNNRSPGSGRFPGFGIVRMFNPSVIHVALNTPRLQGCYKSADAALQAIKQCLDLAEATSSNDPLVLADTQLP